MSKSEDQPVKTPPRGSGNVRRPGVISGSPAAGNNFSGAHIFTPCADRLRLLERVNLTAQGAAFGDVILISPACSGFDQFRNQPNWDEMCQRGTGGLANATGSRSAADAPNTQADGDVGSDEAEVIEKKVSDLHRGFLRQNPGAKTQPKPTSFERTPTGANHP